MNPPGLSASGYGPDERPLLPSLRPHRQESNLDNELRTLVPTIRSDGEKRWQTTARRRRDARRPAFLKRSGWRESNPPGTAWKAGRSPRAHPRSSRTGGRMEPSTGVEPASSSLPRRRPPTRAATAIRIGVEVSPAGLERRCQSRWLAEPATLAAVRLDRAPQGRGRTRTCNVRFRKPAPVPLDGEMENNRKDGALGWDRTNTSAVSARRFHQVSFERVTWHPVRESNPPSLLERQKSLANRRTGQIDGAVEWSRTTLYPITRRVPSHESYDGMWRRVTTHLPFPVMDCHGPMAGPNGGHTVDPRGVEPPTPRLRGGCSAS